MQLLLIADTHLPQRARDLPSAVSAAVDRAEVVFHTGDRVAPELFHRLRDRAAELVACWGPQRRRAAVAAAARARGREAGRGCGSPSCTRPGRRADGSGGCRSRIPIPTCSCSATPHSVDTTSSTGLRLLNPCSPTDRRRQPFWTYMTGHGARRSAARRSAAITCDQRSPALSRSGTCWAWTFGGDTVRGTRALVVLGSHASWLHAGWSVHGFGSEERGADGAAVATDDAILDPVADSSCQSWSCSTGFVGNPEHRAPIRAATRLRTCWESGSACLRD